MSEFIENDAELTLSLEEQAVGAIANNLTTDVEGYALDARQGKVLNEKKLDVSKVANNLTTIESGWALDARQGKWLYENTVGFDDVANDLTTNDSNKVLSAAQGYALKNQIDGMLDGDDASSVQGQINANKQAIETKISMKTVSVSLPVSGWSSNKQTVAVSGVTANNTVIVTAAPASYEHYNECAVRCSAQGAGTLTFTCTDTPTSALTANVLILE